MTIFLLGALSTNCCITEHTKSPFKETIVMRSLDELSIFYFLTSLLIQIYKNLTSLSDLKILLRIVLAKKSLIDTGPSLIILFEY